MSTCSRWVILILAVLLLFPSCGQTEPTTTPLPHTPVPPTDTPIPPTSEPAATATIIDEPEPDDTWIKTYGGDQDAISWDVLLTDDGGYLILGVTNIEFEPEQRGDMYLIKTDAAGNVLWEKTYGGELYEEGWTMVQASDGGLVIGGYTMSFGAGGLDAYLVKVDRDGNELWSKTFGSDLDEKIFAVRQTTDGGYILVGNIVDPDDFVADADAAGYGGDAGRSNIYLVKTDGDGNEVWSRVYDSEQNVLTKSGLQTTDGGFLVLATITYFPENDDDIYLLKLDGDGNEVWTRTLEDGQSTAYNFIQTSDGNYLITASYAPLADDSNEDFQFIKVDPEGNEIWRSIFGDPELIDYGNVLAETTDGGYVATGERTKSRYTGEVDLSLVKIDENGQLLWEQILPFSHSMFAAILQHPDGGYVIGGSAFRDPVFNIFMIKTDSQGNVSE